MWETGVILHSLFVAKRVVRIDTINDRSQLRCLISESSLNGVEARISHVKYK